MDVFVEQIIRRKLGMLDFLTFAGVIVGGVALILAIMSFLPAFGMIALIAVCFGAWYLTSSRNLEFEYSITNGDFTVDKIINRSRRKRVVSLDLREVEEMGKYQPHSLDGKSFEKRIFASTLADGKEDAWYLALRHAQMGYLLLVFSPNEKILEATKPFLKRQVSLDAFGRK